MVIFSGTELKNLLKSFTGKRVAVVGSGMRSHAGVASRVFATLAQEGINVRLVSTSEIKISVLVAEQELERAARALHAAFGLSGQSSGARPLD